MTENHQYWLSSGFMKINHIKKNKSMKTMKKLTAFAILFFVGLAASAQAKIEFKESTIDAGEVPYGHEQTWTFELTNTGDEPLVISRIQTSCGCTTSSKPDGPIAPGSSEQIVVKYDTKRVGPIRRTITVYSNAAETPT